MENSLPTTAGGDRPCGRSPPVGAVWRPESAVGVGADGADHEAAGGGVLDAGHGLVALRVLDRDTPGGAVREELVVDGDIVALALPEVLVDDRGLTG